MYLEIETNILKKFGLTPETFGLLSYCVNNLLSKKFVIDNKDIKDLWYYGFLDKTNRGFKLNKLRFLRVLIAMKECAKDIKNRALSLAPKLIEIFPEGRKEGTNLYWKGNKIEVSNKLQKFLSLFGEEYSDDQIITATKKYVESFNGNYSYMRVLKYFIWKNVLKIGETMNNIEEVSDLLTWLENAGHEDELRQNWINTLL